MSDSAFDTLVRKYIKKDEHIVLAVLGMYASIYALVRVKSIMGKKPLPEPVVAAPAVSGAGGASKWGFEFPTMENFDAWADNDANWAAWEKFMDGPKFDQWLEGK